MQQWRITLLELSPLLLAAVLSIGIWLATRKDRTVLRGRAGVLAASGGLLPVVVSFLYSVVAITPQLLAWTGTDVSIGLQDARFSMPLVAGLVALAILSVPCPRKPPGSTTAGITRRTALTFLSAGWTVALIAVVGVTIALSLAAGLASAPDETGRYAMFNFKIGTMSVSSTIYGWYYSVPAMLLLILLITTAWVGLALVARRPLSEPREQDAVVRRVKSRNIIAVTTGALLFHLAAILGSLAGTSRVGGSLPTDTAGIISVGSPFAALGPFLNSSSFVATCLGAAVCLSVVLTAVPWTARVRQSTIKTAP
ncbi:hypothetical protein [Pseudarthrobacter enclensis]|uniref:Uncharacterized protein n=1 Tax=Pseudarthrobacter enclensis TaxID=993070 RepID=A0ABT9RVY3_9MICC|nr:hypothetical protein [Pseudarthrobacter enclensis]MDP9889393.1 hypothetical protein [Pseudarthrobacter enclensis]